MEFNYFNDRPQNPYAEHRRRINMQIHERFMLRDQHDALEMSITEFMRLYRMPQDVVVDLCNIIRPCVPQRRSPQQVPLMTKLLVALSFYASGSYQRILGRSVDCAVSQTSVSRFVREITEALNHPDVLTRFIRFPLTAQERAPFIARNERFGIPRVLGLIDGFYVRLSHLPHNNERQGFYCRKEYTALNCQIICDSQLYIMNVDARFPGSNNDRYVWNASTAKNIVQQAYWEERCWLLGDSGYFTEPWLHIPLPHAPEGTPEYYYTRLHCRCRNCVERCIGVLKARWRILGLDRCINYRDATYSGMIVNACCVLHNYCLERRVPNPRPLLEPRDYLPDMDPRLPEEDAFLPQNIRQLGNEEMRNIINFVYAQRQQ